ncbi:MAG: hypothetical protein Q7S03_03875 [bacterium]|nr:hypothetical protein [bacterium]
MPNIKNIPFNKDQGRLAALTEKYYTIANWKTIDAIKIEVYHPRKTLKERKEAYKNFENVILALKPIFKEIVYEQNKLLTTNTYKNYFGLNYFDFKVRRDGIPPDKLDLFFKRVDEVIADINQNLPLPTKLPEWYWSEFNIPDSLYYYYKAYNFTFPEHVYQLAKMICPEIEKIIPRIEIGPRMGINPYAKYIKETKSVYLSVTARSDIYNVLTFVHELGHALSFIRLADSGIDPYSKSSYWHEKEAYKFKFQFEEICLPEEIKNASRGEILGDILSTLFQRDIYNNPNQDFDEAYARAINRCYPDKAKQKKNSFYVLENGLMDRPCDATASVVCTELLLEK